VGELKEEIASVYDEEVDWLMAEYLEQYDFATEAFEAVRCQAKEEITSFAFSGTRVR